MTEAPDRSFEKITTDDQTRLAKLAVANLAEFFTRRPEIGALYQNRLLALCLCQGAAKHYVSGKQGVKDFDVWAFFRVHPRRQFPPRRIGHADFGSSKLGVILTMPVIRAAESTSLVAASKLKQARMR
jgi:hypothetical protein